jgi:hypothetical protein
VENRASGPGPDGPSSPAGQGFMSTQRRENGPTRATKTCRLGPRNRWQRLSCTGGAGGLSQVWLALMAWIARVIAKVGTASPRGIVRMPAECFHPRDEDLSPGAPEESAINSLQSDHRITQLVGQDFRRQSCSSPPFRAVPCATSGTPMTRRPSPRLTPTPSVLERLHPFRPHHPAGQCRWTERYDGKRDLHFLNAA